MSLLISCWIKKEIHKKAGGRSDNPASKLMHWLLGASLVGLAIGGSGLYLPIYTDFINTQGMIGIGVVVMLITIGLFWLYLQKFTSSCTLPGRVVG
jgi:hypothetical protein